MSDLHAFPDEEKIMWAAYTTHQVPLYNELNIYRINVQAAYEKLAGNLILSPDEQEKALKFVQPADQKTHMISKHFLRIILSDITGIHAEDIMYQKFGNNKPGLPGIEFNMSHSGNYVLIVVGRVPVGIDVEYINPNFQFEEMIDECFNAEESSYISSGMEPLRNFYTLWTRKEAILKVMGSGITDNLKSICTLSATVINNQQTYSLKTIKISTTYKATVAFQGSFHMYFRYFQYD